MYVQLSSSVTAYYIIYLFYYTTENWKYYKFINIYTKIWSYQPRLHSFGNCTFIFNWPVRGLISRAACINHDEWEHFYSACQYPRCCERVGGERVSRLTTRVCTSERDTSSSCQARSFPRCHLWYAPIESPFHKSGQVHRLVSSPLACPVRSRASYAKYATRYHREILTSHLRYVYICTCSTGERIADFRGPLEKSTFSLSHFFPPPCLSSRRFCASNLRINFHIHCFTACEFLFQIVRSWLQFSENTKDL